MSIYEYVKENIETKKAEKNVEWWKCRKKKSRSYKNVEKLNGKRRKTCKHFYQKLQMISIKIKMNRSKKFFLYLLIAILTL